MARYKFYLLNHLFTYLLLKWYKLIKACSVYSRITTSIYYVRQLLRRRYSVVVPGMCSDRGCHESTFGNQLQRHRTRLLGTAAASMHDTHTPYVTVLLLSSVSIHASTILRSKGQFTLQHGIDDNGLLADFSA